jgi:hypothetical protein
MNEINFGGYRGPVHARQPKKRSLVPCMI